jgi:integrase
MDELEALLARDYQIHGRRTANELSGRFAHLRRLLPNFTTDHAYESTMRYALARRAEGAAWSTARIELSLLGRALTLAARYGQISSRPVIARPSSSNVRRGFLTARSFDQLARALPEPVDSIAVVAYVTGWRRGEVLSLQWRQVDFEVGTIRLEPGTTKNGDGRMYPYAAHPRLRRTIERLALERQGEYVFHRRGRRVKDFRAAWEGACRAAGVEGTLFHDLRRSAVRNYERAGVPRSVAMRLTGHRTESIYRRYAITNENDLSRGVRLLARLGVNSGEGEEKGT